MVRLTIDGREALVPEGTTILGAAASIGIRIPTLCYLKDINEISACRICVVEVEGFERLIPSCTEKVAEGMVVYTNSHRAKTARETNLKLISVVLQAGIDYLSDYVDDVCIRVEYLNAKGDVVAFKEYR